MSCDACGWLAAFCAMLAFGSFGVPIKSKAALDVDIDPLVMQSYKTSVCFLTSWLVLLVPGQSFTFSPWGIVSGLFWVPGGIATVYAVKAAGLATAIGISSSFIVLVSFFWGIFIFHEHVHSRPLASFAVCCMMFGLAGMSYFSTPTTIDEDDVENVIETDNIISDNNLSMRRQNVSLQEFNIVTSNNIPSMRRRNVSLRESMENHGTTQINSNSNAPLYQKVYCEDTSIYIEQDSIVSHGNEFPDDNPVRICNHLAESSADDDLAALENEESHRLRAHCFTRRQRGIMAAIFCGIYGGSILAPMKYAPSNAKGVHYLLSFSIGASLVTLSFWVLRFLYYMLRYRSCKTAYFKLPSFYIRVMWRAGGLCGLLWSIGNFFSLISVFYLGEGVGYPLVQTSILVSGLWGIFYFKEVSGSERIAKWLASSLLTILGILLLSYEHYAK